MLRGRLKLNALEYEAFGLVDAQGKVLDGGIFWGVLENCFV